MTKEEKQVVQDHYTVAQAFRKTANWKMLNHVQEPHARLSREIWIEWEARCNALESLMVQLGIEADE